MEYFENAALEHIVGIVPLLEQKNEIDLFIVVYVLNWKLDLRQLFAFFPIGILLSI